MSEATATQLNRFPEATEFTLCPAQFLGERKFNPFTESDGSPLARAKIKVLSLIYTTRKNFGANAKLSKAQIARKTGLAKSTVAITLTQLRLSDNLIIEMNKDCYKILPKINSKKYFVLDNYLHTKKFNIDGKLKKLPASAVLILERIKAFYLEKDKETGEYKNYDFKNRKPINYFKSSEQGLATLLNLPKSTVSYNIPALLHADLLYRNKRLKYIDENGYAYYKTVSVKGVTGNTSSIFVVPYEVLAVEQRSTYTAPKIEFIPENFDELEIAESEIEKVYAELHTQAIERATAAREVAFKDEILTAAKAELDDAMSAAFTALEDRENVRATRARWDIAHRGYLKRLAELGLSENDFTPQYLCRRCSDTGKTDTGQRCRCRSRIKELIIARVFKA